jgi:RES domain-containing protein
MGAYRFGGRWNSEANYMLYTSENSSLALLENLVHFDRDLAPSGLYLMQIAVDVKEGGLFALPEAGYPTDWQELGSLANRAIGDRFLSERLFLAMKVRSSINAYEHNLLLNPLFPRYHDLVKVQSVHELALDGRLLK